MKAIRILVWILLTLATGQATFSQTEQKRIDRLAGLAHVWGTVKFFHPYLGYRKIDWDKALVDAIPKVNAATTPAEYQAAVNSMLSTLGDTATLAEIPEKPSQLPSTPAVVKSASEAVTLADGVLLINLLDAGRAISVDASQYEKLPKQVRDLLPNAKAVVIDCRAPHASNAFAELYDFTQAFLENVLSTIVEGNKPLSTVRFRTHNGYTSQTSGPSGGYTSSLVMNTPFVLVGAAQTQLPIAFIVNDDSFDVTTYAEGLRAAGIAKVITEGTLTKRLDGNPFTIKLPDGVVVKTATTELLNLDGTTGFATDASIPANSDGELRRVLASFTGPSLPAKTPGASSSSLMPVDQKDDSYPDMRLPSKEYRLLALFRFWNVIETFFPYHDLLESSWATVLQRHIPKFEAAGSAPDYQMTVCELLTEIHDSHGYVAGKKELDEKIGNFVAPLYVRYVHDEAVVVRSYDDKLAVKRGDVIVSIDGRPEKDVRNEVARRIPSSTPQALLWVVGFHLLRGQKDSVVRLTLRGIDGNTRTVDVTRSLDRGDQNIDGAQDRKTPMVSVLPEGYGYVDLARLQNSDIDDMFTKIRDTKAVIFDMRGYPNGTVWPIAPRLTEKVKPEAALFTRPIPSAIYLNDDPHDLSFRQTIPERTGDIYRGKVVVLTDETAVSHAEHSCLFLESAANVTFIGMPTAGVDGDVTTMVLPGGLTVRFTGVAVRHIDGRQLQRVGVQPNIKVEPTAKGIAESRDEILEAAINFLQKTVGK